MPILETSARSPRCSASHVATTSASSLMTPLALASLANAVAARLSILDLNVRLLHRLFANKASPNEDAVDALITFPPHFRAPS